MAYNIPLTGQIRLGRDFNRMNYPNSSTFTEQISMNSQRVVKCHKGPYRYGTPTDSQSFNTNNGLGYRQISPINTAYNTQRQLYPYRGLCNSYTQAATEMSSGTIVQDPLKWWFYKAGSSILANSRVTSRWETSGAMSPNPGGTNSTFNPGSIVEFVSVYATTSANAAIANLMYIGYLEPGTYAVNGMIGKQDGGVELVVRGYSGAGATGTSSDLHYKSTGSTTSDSFIWQDADSGSAFYASQFTVNATYPYILFILQTNTGGYANRWCNSSMPNMHTTSWFYSNISSKYWVEPHITRLS